MLKRKIVQYIEINCFDLESFVKEIYGLDDYSFAATQECNNDTCHTFPDINGKIDQFDQEDVDKIINERIVPTYRNRALLNLLCKDGHIPSGDYLINVSW